MRLLWQHQRQRLLNGALLLIYGVLVIWTSSHTPFFEAPDAYYHFAAIDYIADTSELPPGTDAAYRPWRWAAFHAPLYYLLGALLLNTVEATGLAEADFPVAYPLNPHAQIGEPHAPDNQNFVAHAVTTDGRVWAVRGLSMALGLLTVIGVMVLAQLCLPQITGIAPLAGTLLVFNPQFLFMHGVVSNDTLVTALCTWGIVALAWIIRRGLTWRRVLTLSVLLALASLSKVSGLTLYPVVAGGALWVCWRDRISPWRVAVYAGLGVGAWLLIAGWWYYANWVTYADPTASSQIVALAGRGAGAIIDIPGELRGVFYSFWGLFGWFNISPPTGYYLLPALLIGAGGLGILLGLLRQPGTRSMQANDRVLIGLGLLFIVVFIGSWWRFNQQVNVAQGRLLFPLVGVLAVCMALGLRMLPRVIVGTLMMALLVTVLIVPTEVIQPAYTAPPALRVDDWQPPPAAAAFTIREPWSETACLNVWTTPARLSNGGRVATVDLWWQVTCEFTGFWSVFIHRIDLGRESCQPGDTAHIMAQYDSMPAGGDRSFPAMRGGLIYTDQITVTLPQATSPAQAQNLHVGLYDAGGTFIRAFITADTTNNAAIGIGQCAPETLLYTLDVIQ